MNPLLNQIQPLLTNIKEGSKDEITCLCLWHDDTHPSLSINTLTSQFLCHACQQSGNYVALFEKLGLEPLKEVREYLYNDNPKIEIKSKISGESSNIIPEKIVSQYQSFFTSDIRKTFKEKRGITDKIIDEFYIGYDLSMKRICIPVKDESGKIVNIRKWSTSTEPKMISYAEGFGNARL